MIASAPADFAALELHFAPVDDDAVLTSEILGDASQRDVDSLKTEGCAFTQKTCVSN